MIYGKIWCVVKPSVGIPIMIGAVAISSFCVHLSLTMNTTWVKRFLNGNTAQVTTTSALPAAQVIALRESDQSIR